MKSRLMDRFRQTGSRRRVFMIGLDCAAPELVFELWRDDLPNLRHLAANGLWGELKSSVPAITVPAWSSMLSGKDPGELGIYGFRNRADHSYDNKFIATAGYVREKRVWDYLDRAGKRSTVIGVPQTFPVSPLNGNLISGFLTPGRHNDFAYPASLKEEVLALTPEYDFDVPQFRTEDKDWLLQQIWEMTRKRFQVVDHLLTTKPWDFFMLMEIGVDRVHHGFWSYHDPLHRRYQPGNPYEHVIRDYYTFIDEQIGAWLNEVGDETVILLASDHGAKRMDGGICLNEWLWREGYLNFKSEPEPGKLTPFEEMEVDWSKTRVWGDGGYYGRVFINLQGREPQGVVPSSEYEALRDELSDRLSNIPDPEGENIGTRIFRPEEIYRTVRGVAPDLLVYFGDLLWRSVGSLGHGSVHTFENDTGPDDCNHAENGLFILYDPRWEGGPQEVQGAQLMDVASTILEILEVPVPRDLQGQSLVYRRSA